jgi:lipopolysaccharide export system protein LptC
MNVNYLIIIGLSTIALGIVWIVRDLEKSAPMITFEQTRLLPDFVLVDFSTVSTTPQGTLKYQFQGQLLKHYSIIETEVEHPYLVYYQDQQPNWYIWGEQGLMASNNEWIKLLGNNYFWHFNSQGNLLKIFSKDVLYKPQESYAETSAFTRLETKESNTTGIGMQLFLNTQEATLLSQVKGSYEKDH